MQINYVSNNMEIGTYLTYAWYIYEISKLGSMTLTSWSWKS